MSNLLTIKKRIKDLPILCEGEIGYGVLYENEGYTVQESNRGLYEGFFTENFEAEKYINKPIIIKCILQRANARNRNGRIYPRPILEREVKKYQKMIDESSALGELDHPESTNISLKNTSHNIKEMWWEGDTLWGKLELLVTPGYLKFGICSRPADSIFDDFRRGIKIGISSRGVGSVKEIDGDNIVEEDFELLGFDAVATPSTHGAYFMANRDINESRKTEIVKPKSSLIKSIDYFLKKF